MNCPLVESILSTTNEGANDNDPDYLPSTQDECTDSSDTDIDDTKGQCNLKCIIVYISELKKLLCFCPSCGSRISLIEPIGAVAYGSQYALRISCVNGCYVTWKAQPDGKLIKGIRATLLLL